MEKSKLMQLLHTFTASEWRDFQDFVGSPYYNKHKETVRLFTYLKKLAPDRLQQEYIDRRHVYNQLFPSSPMTNGHLII